MKIRSISKPCSFWTSYTTCLSKATVWIENGKTGHALQLFLVRVLFCLFADDTGLFSPKDSFLELVERTREDGADTGTFIARLFQAPNTRRARHQDRSKKNWGLFPISTAACLRNGWT